MISENLQAQYDREDFEHSRRAKIRKWVEFFSLVFLIIALGAQIVWVLS
jgi:hypothetical protein